MTRLGIAAMAVIYTLGLAAVFATFVSVITDWPVRPSLVATEPTFTQPTLPAPTLPAVEPTLPLPTLPPLPTLIPTAPVIPTAIPTLIPPTTLIRGRATYYCLPPVSPCTVGFPATGLYAAAGPELREALGDWRGRKVTIWRGSRHVTVTLIDTMANPAGLVDLYGSVFLLLAPLSTGVIDVEIRW